MLKLKNSLKKTAELSQRNPDIRFLYFDQGRFGFHQDQGKGWFKKGSTPTFNHKIGYENFYAYSALDPIKGEHYSLFLPYVNAKMMNIYLEHLSEELHDDMAVLILDQAGYHTAQHLEIPDNIVLMHLPPYSPELNPVERWWRYLKRHVLRNRLYLSIEAIMDSLQDEMREMSATKISGICGTAYLVN